MKLLVPLYGSPHRGSAPRLPGNCPARSRLVGGEPLSRSDTQTGGGDVRPLLPRSRVHPLPPALVLPAAQKGRHARSGWRRARSSAAPPAALQEPAPGPRARRRRSPALTAEVPLALASPHAVGCGQVAVLRLLPLAMAYFLYRPRPEHGAARSRPRGPDDQRGRGELPVGLPLGPTGRAGNRQRMKILAPLQPPRIILLPRDLRPKPGPPSHAPPRLKRPR